MEPDPPHRLRGLLPQLHSAAANLRGALLKVADYLLAHPNQAVSLSISELARRTGTSEAAITRLCKRLGYQGFKDLQINLAYDLRRDEETIDEEIVPDDDLVSVIEKTCAAHVQTLLETQRTIDVNALEQAVAALASARRVEICGFGGNHPIAVDAMNHFIKLGVPVSVQPDPYTLAMTAVLLQPGDVVMGISNTGSNSDLEETFHLARQRGATTLLLTSHLGSPLTHVADIHLCTARVESLFQGEPISARFNLLLLVDVLFISVALRTGGRVTENLRLAQGALAYKRERRPSPRPRRSTGGDG